MKVYNCPKEVPAPEPDYKNYDRDREIAREEEHIAKLKAWLVKNGYNGKYTGKTVGFPVGDGYARYMLADGKKACLIHLPYVDGYHYPDVKFLPKAEIIRRIEHEKKLAAIFSKPKAPRRKGREVIE